jgi:hypothetical protein
MLRLAIVFLVIALIFAVLSFLGHRLRRQPFSGLRETRFPARRLEK